MDRGGRQQQQQHQPQQHHQQQQQQRRGGNQGGGRRGTPRAGEERPKKEAILDLGKYRDQKVRVKFQGGREVLKGYDQLMNLVLEEVKETLRDPEDENVLLDKTRDLGTVVVRGPLLLSLSPVDGSEVIDNPFIQQS